MTRIKQDESGDPIQTGWIGAARSRAAWFGAGTVVSLAVAFLLLRNSDPPLTRDALSAARARWSATAIRSYTYEIDVNDAHYVVRVLDGRVVEMTPARGNARSLWTLEGMFGFLETELDNAARPNRAYGVDDPESVVLRAAFDPDLGIPRRFFRHVIGRGMSTQWELTAFEPYPKSGSGFPSQAK